MSVFTTFCRWEREFLEKQDYKSISISVMVKEEGYMLTTNS